MPSIEAHIIHDCKHFINNNDLDTIKSVWEEYSNTEDADTIAWDSIYKDVYIHACLKKKRDIIAWLDTMYAGFNPIQKIALRQMFPYAKYLLRK